MKRYRDQLFLIYVEIEIDVIADFIEKSDLSIVFSWGGLALDGIEGHDGGLGGV